MGKQNYRESIEKDRQEISVGNPAAPSRRAARNSAKNQPKKKKSVLLPTLFFLFILIPVTILIYVAFLYEPDDTITAEPASKEVSIETNTALETPIVPVEVEEDKEEKAEQENKEEKAAQEKAEKEKADKEKAEKEKIRKLAAEKAAAEEQAKKEREAKAAEDAKAQEIARQEAAAAQEREKAAAAKAKEDAKKQPSSSKTVVVQPQETLYRIAVNNYGAAGAAAAVEKIKQANGLSSNSISPGQTLILP
ncbi:LysM peptidoglycan-binding domain-containing protein [Planococcus shixiaomingii]|uniref:LysM peptidoglycan-binding domain-containing protein n=1 Tax=Planococcus shixiaomingii TaxID=3058393 RepID=UPI002609F2A3|nr:LysM peptidoglycan-binding domain-containing protein [Planococcus sp. N022]WKA53381.1 LysM peptidoglycan-binding domain-containing protein [Planococcus sp. N022]